MISDCAFLQLSKKTSLFAPGSAVALRAAVGPLAPLRQRAVDIRGHHVLNLLDLVLEVVRGCR